MSTLSADGTVTVAVVAYNAETCLSRCLDSVLSQTRRELEVLVLDDGSEDATLAVAEDYAVRDHRVRVIAAAHQGVAAARNRCLKEAKGDWLTFADADDCIADDAVESLLLL